MIIQTESIFASNLCARVRPHAVNRDRDRERESGANTHGYAQGQARGDLGGKIQCKSVRADCIQRYIYMCVVVMLVVCAALAYAHIHSRTSARTCACTHAPKTINIVRKLKII